jgi:hypothetical protein
VAVARTLAASRLYVPLRLGGLGWRLQRLLPGGAMRPQ